MDLSYYFLMVCVQFLICVFLERSLMKIYIDFLNSYENSDKATQQADKEMYESVKKIYVWSHNEDSRMYAKAYLIEIAIMILVSMLFLPLISIIIMVGSSIFNITKNLINKIKGV